MKWVEFDGRIAESRSFDHKSTKKCLTPQRPWQGHLGHAQHQPNGATDVLCPILSNNSLYAKFQSLSRMLNDHPWATSHFYGVE